MAFDSDSEEATVHQDLSDEWKMIADLILKDDKKDTRNSGVAHLSHHVVASRYKRIHKYHTNLDGHIHFELHSSLAV
jgi:hypothetical protein